MAGGGKPLSYVAINNFFVREGLALSRQERGFIQCCIRHNTH